MKTKSNLLKCLVLLLLINHSCSPEQEKEIGDTSENSTTIQLVSENESSSSCQNQYAPIIEDVNENTIDKIKVGTPFYFWMNVSLCQSTPKINLYLEKVTPSGNVSEYTIATNISIPLIQNNRLQITLPNSVDSGEYIIKIVTQIDIPNGIFVEEVIYTSSFNVFNMSTSIVPNGHFDTSSSWTLSSGGSITNSKLITPDMWGDDIFTATSSYFTISAGTKYLILSNGLHKGKFQLINSSNQPVFTYINYEGYGSGDQMKSLSVPSTGNYKIKFTYYGDSFGDSGEEAQGTNLDYVILN